jgi:hypothetical protein
MRDDYQLEEVSSAVSLGLLASDIVIAASKLLRGVAPSDTEHNALVSGESLLRKMGAPLDGVGRSRRLGQLGSRNAIDALHAVQARMPGKDVQEQVVRLADALQSVLGGATVAEYEAELESVRDLFAHLGGIEVSRVTNLSRPTPELPPWLTPISTASSRS